jgi:hypothetical protein
LKGFFFREISLNRPQTIPITFKGRPVISLTINDDPEELLKRHLVAQTLRLHGRTLSREVGVEYGVPYEMGLRFPATCTARSGDGRSGGCGLVRLDLGFLLRGGVVRNKEVMSTRENGEGKGSRQENPILYVP